MTTTATSQPASIVLPSGEDKRDQQQQQQQSEDGSLQAQKQQENNSNDAMRRQQQQQRQLVVVIAPPVIEDKEKNQQVSRGEGRGGGGSEINPKPCCNNRGAAYSGDKDNNNGGENRERRSDVEVEVEVDDSGESGELSKSHATQSHHQLERDQFRSKSIRAKLKESNITNRRVELFEQLSNQSLSSSSHGTISRTSLLRVPSADARLATAASSPESSAHKLSRRSWGPAKVARLLPAKHRQSSDIAGRDNDGEIVGIWLRDRAKAGEPNAHQMASRVQGDESESARHACADNELTSKDESNNNRGPPVSSDGDNNCPTKVDEMLEREGCRRVSAQQRIQRADACQGAVMSATKEQNSRVSLQASTSSSASIGANERLFGASETNELLCGPLPPHRDGAPSNSADGITKASQIAQDKSDMSRSTNELDHNNGMEASARETTIGPTHLSGTSNAASSSSSLGSLAAVFGRPSDGMGQQQPLASGRPKELLVDLVRKAKLMQASRHRRASDADGNNDDDDDDGGSCGDVVAIGGCGGGVSGSGGDGEVRIEVGKVERESRQVDEMATSAAIRQDGSGEVGGEMSSREGEQQTTAAPVITESECEISGQGSLSACLPARATISLQATPADISQAPSAGPEPGAKAAALDSLNRCHKSSSKCTPSKSSSEESKSKSTVAREVQGISSGRRRSSSGGESSNNNNNNNNNSNSDIIIIKTSSETTGSSKRPSDSDGAAAAAAADGTGRDEDVQVVLDAEAGGSTVSEACEAVSGRMSASGSGEFMFNLAARQEELAAGFYDSGGLAGGGGGGVRQAERSSSTSAGQNKVDGDSREQQHKQQQQQIEESKQLHARLAQSRDDEEEASGGGGAKGERINLAKTSGDGGVDVAKGPGEEAGGGGGIAKSAFMRKRQKDNGCECCCCLQEAAPEPAGGGGAVPCSCCTNSASSSASSRASLAQGGDRSEFKSCPSGSTASGQQSQTQIAHELQRSRRHSSTLIVPSNISSTSVAASTLHSTTTSDTAKSCKADASVDAGNEDDGTLSRQKSVGGGPGGAESLPTVRLTHNEDDQDYVIDLLSELEFDKNNTSFSLTTNNNLNKRVTSSPPIRRDTFAPLDDLSAPLAGATSTRLIDTPTNSSYTTAVSETGPICTVTATADNWQAPPLATISHSVSSPELSQDQQAKRGHNKGPIAAAGTSNTISNNSTSTSKSKQKGGWFGGSARGPDSKQKKQKNKNNNATSSSSSNSKKSNNDNNSNNSSHSSNSKGLVRQVSRVGRAVYSKLRRKFQNSDKKKANNNSSGQQQVEDSSGAASYRRDEHQKLIGANGDDNDNDGAHRKESAGGEPIVLVESRAITLSQFASGRQSFSVSSSSKSIADRISKLFSGVDDYLTSEQSRELNIQLGGGGGETVGNETSITTPLLTLTRPSSCPVRGSFLSYSDFFTEPAADTDDVIERKKSTKVAPTASESASPTTITTTTTTTVASGGDQQEAKQVEAAEESKETAPASVLTTSDQRDSPGEPSVDREDKEESKTQTERAEEQEVEKKTVSTVQILIDGKSREELEQEQQHEPEKDQEQEQKERAAESETEASVEKDKDVESELNASSKPVICTSSDEQSIVIAGEQLPAKEHNQSEQADQQHQEPSSLNNQLTSLTTFETADQHQDGQHLHQERHHKHLHRSAQQLRHRSASPIARARQLFARMFKDRHGGGNISSASTAASAASDQQQPQQQQQKLKKLANSVTSSSATITLSGSSVSSAGASAPGASKQIMSSSSSWSPSKNNRPNSAQLNLSALERQLEGTYLADA